MMYGREKSDRLVVPVKPANKVGQPTAEVVEERGLAKGNGVETNTRRIQRREKVPSGLDRIRQAAKRDKKQRFTALMHHIYDIALLRKAYQSLRHGAAVGADGVSYQAYGESLEANLQELSERLKRGAYRARPVRRAYIPKADGSQRPLGVPALEDKIVQRAVVEVLNAIYEEDFQGFSYGFRPGRNQHTALDAVTVGLKRRKVNWVLDADIRRFFDTLDHGWLIRFVEHRIGDKRVVRLIQKWLGAGVLEDGVVSRSEVGTVQGGSISPLLANIYLHYVYDQWVHQWRNRHARGDVIVVRYADDTVVGFQYRDDAERFQAALCERLARYGLELHPDKTRLLEFGRFAAMNRRRRGEGKPPTFNFLGLTHICGKTRTGRFQVVRQTIRKRMQAKLREVKAELRRRWHHPVPEVGKWLAAVIRGHIRYYGVPGNGPALQVFRVAVIRLWHRALRRRSQNDRGTWKRTRRLVARYIPPVRISHPYPSQRLRVNTRGRSPVR